MSRSRIIVLAVAVGVLVAVAALALGLRDPEQAVRTTGEEPSGEPAGAFDEEACAALVPDTVVTTLGWQDAGEVGVQAMRCQRAGSQGSVTVIRRAVVPTGTQTDEQAAREVYDDQCGLLQQDASDYVPSPTWLPDGVTGCGTRPMEQGMTQAVALTDSGEVFELRVVTLEQVKPIRVEEALGELARAAG